MQFIDQCSRGLAFEEWIYKGTSSSYGCCLWVHVRGEKMSGEHIGGTTHSYLRQQDLEGFVEHHLGRTLANLHKI